MKHLRIKTRRPAAIVWCWLLVVIVGGPATGQTSDDRISDSKTGTITGQAISDNGQPLANVQITISAMGSGQMRTTVTDSEGNFRARGLDSGLYSVFGSAPGFIGRVSASNSSPSGLYRPGDTVRLEFAKGGVITGTVTLDNGEPVVGVTVRATRVRESSGKPSLYPAAPIERTTDDRGVYRIYGLVPGIYVVSAGGRSLISRSDPFDRDVPTYAPASVRDAATEIAVAFGDERTGVDIRYRAEPGHAISGVINTIGNGSFRGGTVWLTQTLRLSGRQTQTIFQPSSREFAIYGLGDGDYELVGQGAVAPGEVQLSDPVRITVKGTDVGGVQLNATPLGAIAGHLIMETSTAADCQGKHRPLLTETTVSARRNEEAASPEPQLFPSYTSASAWPDAKGEFRLRNLRAGDYNLNSRFYAKYWYLKSITIPTSGPPQGARKGARQVLTDAARSWVSVKAGQQLNGLSVTIAEGAASLRGSIKREEGEKTPARFNLYLVPADKETSADPWRFFATRIRGDATFELGNFPPGRYWILTHVLEDNELELLEKLHQPDGAEFRLKLRREAEAAKTEIEFKPCQNVVDYVLAVNAPRRPIGSIR